MPKFNGYNLKSNEIYKSISSCQNCNLSIIMRPSLVKLYKRSISVSQMTTVLYRMGVAPNNDVTSGYFMPKYGHKMNFTCFEQNFDLHKIYNMSSL